MVLEPYVYVNHSGEFDVPSDSKWQKSKKNERPRKNVEKQYDPICCEIETDGEYRPSPPWKNSRKMAAKSKHAKFVTDNAYIDAVSPIFSNER